MGNTSDKVKNEWNKKNYDRVTIMLKAGEKDNLKAEAIAAGQSVSRYIIEAINDHAGRNLLTVLDDESKKKK